MNPLKQLALTLLLGVSIAVTAQQAEIEIQVIPEKIYAVTSRNSQELSFDFRLVNKSADEFRITDIRVKIFDKKNKLMYWKKVDSNGSQPSMLVLATATVPPNGSIYIFNPFHTLDTNLPVGKMNFEFHIGSKSGRKIIPVTVIPSYAKPATKLDFPVSDDMIWIYDGSDYLSHHRRFNPDDPVNKDVMKIKGHPQRFGIDVCILRNNGELYKENSLIDANWYGFGHPITAPAAGTIVAIENDRGENIPFDMDKMKSDPLIALGNYVVIDHHNGEFSMLAHFKKGTIKVTPGQDIKTGDLLGEMGRSGMGVGLVHLHYELRDNANILETEGLPLYFKEYTRIFGDKMLKMKGAPVPSSALLKH